MVRSIYKLKILAGLGFIGFGVPLMVWGSNQADYGDGTVLRERYAGAVFSVGGTALVWLGLKGR